MMKPVKDIPTEEGLYWWRSSKESKWEPVMVERSGHKPPYWHSWELCSGCITNDLCPEVSPLDLNYDASGPLEEGYVPCKPFRGGEWWPDRLEPPPRGT